MAGQQGNYPYTRPSYPPPPGGVMGPTPSFAPPNQPPYNSHPGFNRGGPPPTGGNMSGGISGQMGKMNIGPPPTLPNNQYGSSLQQPMNATINRTNMAPPSGPLPPSSQIPSSNPSTGQPDSLFPSTTSHRQLNTSADIRSTNRYSPNLPSTTSMQQPPPGVTAAGINHGNMNGPIPMATHHPPTGIGGQPPHTGPPPPTGMGTGPPPPTGMGTGPPPPTGMGTGPPPPTGMGTGPPPSTGMGTGPPPPTGMGTGPPLPTGMGTGPPPPTGMGGYPSQPTGSPYTRPPPPTGMTGPPPSSTGMTGPPPPTGMTGPPPSSLGPPSGNMSGPPFSRNMSGPLIGSSSDTRSMTGPPPVTNQQGNLLRSVSGPVPHAPTMSTGLPPPPPSGIADPPPGMNKPPPPTGNNMTGAPLSAPLGQRYPRTDGPPPAGSDQSNTKSSQPYAPYSGQPGFTGPPGMQKQPQLPELLPVNLLENRNTILPSEPFQRPAINLPGHLSNFVPDPSVFCSSMNAVPATSGLLNKMKLPLAIHIHPFKDSKAKSCPVINPSVIVRCRVCRAYINPYVSFSDARHWRCNMCFRTNVVPEDYDYNPHSGKRGDRTHHAELRHSSVEYIAPSEYMVRPPQPSVYLFLIDVSYYSVETGLLGVFCRTLLDCLTKLPGDGRTMVGFLTYDQHLHFYNLKSSQTQPQMLVVPDVNDVFIPSPSSLLVNLRESKELVKNLLEELPKMFADQRSGDSALGAALQVAEKLLHPIGGRVTVIQSSLPNIGPGALKVQEQQSSMKKDQLKMQTSTDFYKKLAIECSSQQIAVDVFVFSNPRRFIDLATFSTIAKFSSGQISYYADFHQNNESSTLTVSRDLKRYFTRNIGFEAVMRVRCTEGLSLHTFHGNFFVRSTDLLSLPNVNPDHGFCMNLAIDENLKEYSTVCFQAALLYTTYRGERRIRVHTLCLPVSENLSQIYASIDVQATAAVLAKMAVDRVCTASLGDAREALLNTVQDSTKAYRSNIGSGQSSQFILPTSMKLLPLYILSLLKHPSLTLNPNVMVDERAQAANLILTLPLKYLLANIYPTLHALHTLSESDVIDVDGEEVVSPPMLQLSAEHLNRQGIYLMDYGKGIFVWVSKDTPTETIKQLFGVPHFGAIPEFSNDMPIQSNSLSKLVQVLIRQIKMSRQCYMPLYVIREDSSLRKRFVNKLVQDKTDDGTSYYELLSHVARQINK